MKTSLPPSTLARWQLRSPDGHAVLHLHSGVNPRRFLIAGRVPAVTVSLPVSSAASLRSHDCPYSGAELSRLDARWLHDLPHGPCCQCHLGPGHTCGQAFVFVTACLREETVTFIPFLNGWTCVCAVQGRPT